MKKTVSNENSDDTLVFFGYPYGNYLKQICVIMSLWHSTGRFPIHFLEIQYVNEIDESEHFL